MQQAPRQKLLDFIATFQPRRGLGGCAQEQVGGKGDKWLTDDQLRDIAETLARRHRFTQKLNRHNRRISAAQ